MRRPSDGAPRLAVLDGLRLFAALAVVLFHYVAVSESVWDRPPRELFPWLYPIASYGWLGVELFFVISGFVICMSAWGRPLGDFFSSRVTRLYPMYWVGVLLTTGALYVASKPTLKFSEILANLTMMHTPLGVHPVSGVYWTLWVELHFYLVFAIVVWRGVNYRRVIAFCVLWTVASVLAQAIQVPAVTLLVSPKYSMYFIAGIAMYLMYRYGQSLLLWAIIGMSWILAQRHILSWVAEQSRQTEGIVTYTGTMIAITLIFLVMIAVSLGWLSWIRGSWFAIAGAATYPLYLIHWEPGWLVIDRLQGVLKPWAILLGLIAVMVLAAWLLHRFFERPLQPRIRRSLTDAVGDMRLRTQNDAPRWRPVEVADPPADETPAPTEAPISAAPAPLPAHDPVPLATPPVPKTHVGGSTPTTRSWPPAVGERSPVRTGKPWPSTLR